MDFEPYQIELLQIEKVNEIPSREAQSWAATNWKVDEIPPTEPHRDFCDHPNTGKVAKHKPQCNHHSQITLHNEIQPEIAQNMEPILSYVRIWRK